MKSLCSGIPVDAVEASRQACGFRCVWTWFQLSGSPCQSLQIEPFAAAGAEPCGPATMNPYCSSMSGEDGSTGGAAAAKWIRRAVLLGALVWACYLLLFHGVPTVCHQELNDAGTAVRVCGPMEAHDPRVFLYLLVVGVLAFPELSELEIAGLLTIKRRLDEAKAEATELKRDLGDIRTQAFAAVTAAISAKQQVDVTVNVDRSEQTGQALNEAAGAGDGVLDETETLGAYAQLALEAVVAGLPDQLSDSLGPNASIQGFTFGDDEDLELSFVASRSGAASSLDELRETDHFVVPKVDGVYIYPRSGHWIATAPAREDDRNVVGGIAVVAVAEEFHAGPGPLTSDEMNDFAAQAVIVGGIFGRALIDLAGEVPRVIVAGDSEDEGSH